MRMTKTPGHHRRPQAVPRLIRLRWRTSVTVGVVGALAAGFLPSLVSSSSPARAAPQTVVSLTFDDGTSDQTQAASILASHKMKGTFYIITGNVGAPGFLTRDNLTSLAAAGNEIAGHTVTHPDLTTLPADEVARQVCNSRASLASWGFQVKSFAYPYAAFNGATESAVSNCGYNSARAVGDTWSPKSCGDCLAAETLPPADAYALRTPDGIDSTWTLNDLERVVTRAETRGGGLVTFTFHQLCASGCGSLAVSPTLLSNFTSWLATRATRGTVVKTVGDAIGGPVKPVVTAPPATNTNVVNGSLETGGTASTDFPQCWFPGGWGTNSVTWTRTNDAHSGQWAERVNVTNYSSGDAKLLSQFDLGACTPSVNPGAAYTIDAWYKSDARAQFVVHYRNSSNTWLYWTASPWFDPAAGWTDAHWTTPAVPADAVGISFGLALVSNGTLTTDDYSSTLASSGTAAATAAPAVYAQPAGLAGGGVLTQPDLSLAPAAAATAGNGWRTHHNKKHKTWGPHDLAFVPGPGKAKPGTPIAVPAPPDQ
jgi:peptidoglycan/xylan/chitin deacetylase (PgdA/CDA1 family)